MAASKSSWPEVAAVVGLLTVIISVLLTAFAWPAVRSSVHDVPIAVAGPAAATGQVTAALEQRMPGAFDVTLVADSAAAEAAILDREVYGAIDLSTGKPQVLIASAASASVAQALQQVATGLAQAAPGPQGATGNAGTAGRSDSPGAAGTQAAPGAAGAQGPAVTVRDVAALPADDPRGAGLAAGSLPLIIGGLLAALLLTNRVRGTGRRIAGAFAFAVTGGLAIAAILQFWFGSLGGDYWLNAGVVALSTAAISLTLLGLESLLGLPGFGLGAAVMMLVGNPLSGMATAPQMLPGWSGALGQLLPPGAAGTLLRSTAFFDGAGAIQPLIVLLAWLALGTTLCLLSGLRKSRRAAPADITAAEPVPAVVA
ncbi:hypothetical protein OHA21_51460 [Actinoplanes sp. NBC_00393]|uniref:hypothetical protein n=1 Tax=Actinoplanes sp. NBC_00393 TaxID=2975953 RepID=UPI002E1CE997